MKASMKNTDHEWEVSNYSTFNDHEINQLITLNVTTGIESSTRRANHFTTENYSNTQVH